MGHGISEPRDEVMDGVYMSLGFPRLPTMPLFSWWLQTDAHLLPADIAVMAWG
jgi:hypothetical protein